MKSLMMEEKKRNRTGANATPGRGRNTILLVRRHFSDSLLVAEEGRSRGAGSPLLLVEVGTASFLSGATFSDMPDSLGLNPLLSFGTLGTVHSRQIIQGQAPASYANPTGEKGV